MRWMIQYVENRCALKSHLKAVSVNTVSGSRKMSDSEFQTDGPTVV